VFDVKGREVSKVVDRELSPGEHTAVWSLPTDAPAGTYFYRAKCNGQVATGRVVTVR
jgi:uncharacterized protein YfaS (alpha-2-macroglobulin family)